MQSGNSIGNDDRPTNGKRVAAQLGGASMRHIAFGSVFVAILVALVFLGFRDSLEQEARASHISGTLDLVAIDMVNNFDPGDEEDSGGNGTGVADCNNGSDNDADTRVDAADGA